MKKKVKTRKKITLQSVIMYILLILTALMFATPMLFTLLSSIKTKVEIFCETILLAGSSAMVQLCGSLDKCQHESLLFKQFDSGRSDSNRTCNRVYNGSLRTVQI